MRNLEQKSAYGRELRNARIGDKLTESDVVGSSGKFARDSPLDRDWGRRVQDIDNVLRSEK